MPRLLLTLLVFLLALTGGVDAAFSRHAAESVLTASDYALDASGRRALTVLADGTWWKYTYGGHGQVTTAERRRIAGSAPDDSDPALPGQSSTYSYDGLGNRTERRREQAS